jgi:hypothetical protein
MAERKVVPFDEFYYQLKLTHLFQKHPVYIILVLKNQVGMPWKFSKKYFPVEESAFYVTNTTKSY